ncbi:MAG: putative CRISPR-associated protein [bacterium]|nr:putative CRISPR-associated protein [bacterium]
MNRILISTVGTSLWGHWRAKLEEQKLKEFSEQSRIWLVNHLRQLDENDKLLGAEITSLNSLLRQNKINRDTKLYFCVSDTPEGKFIGEVLGSFYANQFHTVNTKTIKDLQHTDEKKFLRGLKHLVDYIAELKKKFPDVSIAINATGGYKAQISFAGLIGQAFGIPVYYQFEKFDSIVELPPMPISFSFDLWLDHYELFESAEAKFSDEFLKVTDSEYQRIPESMKVLFLEEDGNVFLSALGTLYHQLFLQQFPNVRKQLLPPDSGLAPEQKKISYENKNSGKHHGLKEYLEKLLQKPYITRINTYYYNPDLPKKNQFRKSTKHPDAIEGIYSDGTATTEFCVYTTAKNASQIEAAVVDLNMDLDLAIDFRSSH